MCVFVTGSAGVWAWGNGSGGKLGLGDNKDRYEPCIVPTLRAKAIVQVRVLHSRDGGLAAVPHTVWAVYCMKASIVQMQSLWSAQSVTVRWYDLTLGGGGVLAQHGDRTVPTHAEGRLVVYVGFRLPRAVGAGRQGTQQ
jgi:hypothetical protein